MILLTGTAWQNKRKDKRLKSGDQRGQTRCFRPDVPSSGSFTIIEVLLVVLVLSIIAGLTIPNFSHTYADLTLRKTAEEIAQLMRYAQGRAITKGEEVRLETNRDSSVYYLTRQTDDQKSEGDEDLFVPFEGRFGRVFKLPSGIEVKGEKDHVSFNPDGSIDKQYVDVCHDGRCFTISTKEQRGHVRIIQRAAR